MPAVGRYQIHGLKVVPENTKPLLILDNVQAHSSEDVLVANDGRIRVMVSPTYMISVIQPMD